MSRKISVSRDTMTEKPEDAMMMMIMMMMMMMMMMMLMMLMMMMMTMNNSFLKKQLLANGSAKIVATIFKIESTRYLIIASFN